MHRYSAASMTSDVQMFRNGDSVTLYRGIGGNQHPLRNGTGGQGTATLGAGSYWTTNKGVALEYGEDVGGKTWMMKITKSDLKSYTKYFTAVNDDLAPKFYDKNMNSNWS